MEVGAPRHPPSARSHAVVSCLLCPVCAPSRRAHLRPFAVVSCLVLMGACSSSAHSRAVMSCPLCPFAKETIKVEGRGVAGKGRKSRSTISAPQSHDFYLVGRTGGELGQLVLGLATTPSNSRLPMSLLVGRSASFRSVSSE